MFFETMKDNLHLLLIIFSLHFVVAAAALDAKIDRQSLLSFKIAISDPQNRLSGWNSTTASHCTWFGVTCTTTSNESRVQSLNLTGLGLLGTLSPHLSNLTALKILDLSINSLRGPIPSGLGRLSLLTRLLLSENYLTGTIPDTISLCSNLRYLVLSFNNLTGRLPPELGRLRRLQILDAAGNNLTGFIPPSFGNLSALSSVSLARNQLYGSIPNELGYLSNLSTIQLSDNRFDGEILASIFNLSSLIVLSLANNNFSGNLPGEIGFGIPNIEQLFLGQNKFRGKIPESLSNASRIRSLDLSLNQFQGTIPSVGKMKNLIFLILGGNNLSSTAEQNSQLFESLKNCTKLKSLILYSNQLAGELPSSLANFSTEIEHFCIDSNQFTGSFPRGIENFQNLISLAIQRNFFTGPMPRSIGALNKVQKITLQQNMFSGEIPEVFGNLSQLFELTMGANLFSGKIPISLGQCQRLSALDIAYNSLSGSVPREIFTLSHLNTLYLANNSLSDSLSIEIGSLKQLEFMDVSMNSLSGYLPETIGSCQSVRFLILARNNFTGVIPKSLGKLVALESLDLSSNGFSGLIPEELVQLRSLKELNISFNDLEGRIPGNGVFRNLTWNSIQGNSKLCANLRDVSRNLRISTCGRGKKSSKNLVLVVVLVLISLLVISLVPCLAWKFVSRKTHKGKGESGILSSPSLKGLPPKISYSDIHQATNGFAVENLVGKGSFGLVYKGLFGSGDNGFHTALAVKVIDLDQSKALKSFNAECEALRSVRHRNLVRVITSCSSIDHKGGEFKALVMDFLSNGNLGNWLHPKEGEFQWNLNLTQRLGIAIDVASAMDYLHHDCEPPIVHCDLKPPNVLLDDSMGAHVGDFGLARFLNPDSTMKKSSTVGLKGSIGYIAPEYGFGSNVSTKGDVYSFGILLLEIFTAKKPTDEIFNNGLNLNNYVSSALQPNQVLKIVDPRLLRSANINSSDGNTNTSSSSFSGSVGSSSNDNIAVGVWETKIDKTKIEACLDAVVRVGCCCASDAAGDRPTMREALTKLQEVKKNLLG